MKWSSIENVTNFPRLYGGKCAKKYIGKIWDDFYFQFWIIDKFVWWYVETDNLRFEMLMYIIIIEGGETFWCPVGN